MEENDALAQNVQHPLVGLLEDWLPGIPLDHWLAPILAAVAATMAFLVVWRVTRMIFTRLAGRVKDQTGSRIRGLRFQNQEIFSAEQMTGALQLVVNALGLGLRLLLLYVWLHFVLSLFALTQGIAEQILASLVDALTRAFWDVVGYLPNLLWLLLIFLIARAAIHAARLFFRGVTLERIRLPGLYPEFGKPTFEIVRIAIIVLTAALMVPYLPGQESPAFRAIGVFLGVLVSLGSTGAVANVIAGIVLTYTRSFKLGDRVKIADTVGDVIEKSSFATRVRTSKNVEVTVPNATVLSNHVINYSAQANAAGVILHTKVTIGYDAPWQQVHELLIAAAIATDGIEEEPTPFVFQLALDDAYVHYELNGTTRSVREMQRIYSDLHRNIQDRFNEAGIEIASPHFLALRDGNRMNVPDAYLPRDYEPGSLRIGPIEWTGAGPRGGSG